MSKPEHVPAKSPAPAYAPPAELVAKAEQSLANASKAQLAAAETLYGAYGSVTAGRSAVTGAELKPFSECPVLVRAGWLHVALRALDAARAVIECHPQD